MGIISKIRQAVGLETKAVTGEYGYNGMQFIPIDNLGNYTMLSGKYTGYEKISVVYKIVNHIAGRVAEAVIEQYENKKEGEQIDESDFLTRIEQPNPYQSKADFLNELSVYDDLQGEFYIWVEKATVGKDFFLWSLPPQNIAKTASGYSWNGIPIPAEEIYHYRRFNAGYRVDQQTSQCVSPLSVAYSDLKVIDYANATSIKQLSKGAVPGAAWVEQDSGEQPVEEEELKQLRDKLVERYANTQTYGEVPLMSHKIGYTPFGITAKDAMILEQKEVSSEGIANAFGYPLPLLYNKTGGLNSSERKDATKELLTSVVFPKLEKICGILTKILKLYEQGHKITFDKYSYPEMEEDWNTLSQSLERMPFLTWNEKRKVLRFEPIDNPVFDEPFIPNSITTLDEFVSGGTSTSDIIPNNGDY